MSYFDIDIALSFKNPGLADRISSHQLFHPIKSVQDEELKKCLKIIFTKGQPTNEILYNINNHTGAWDGVSGE